MRGDNGDVSPTRECPLTANAPARSRPPLATARTELTTEIGLLSLALIWGANFTVIKLVLAELPPLAFNALRFPLASLLLLAFLARSREGPLLPPRGSRAAVLALGVLGNVVYQPLFIVGVDRTTAGNASLLLATTPVWTILLSAAFGHERPSAPVWIGVLGTVAGMGLVVAGGSGLHLGAETLVGDVLMVGAALCWSLYTVGARGIIGRHGPLRVTAWTLWVGTVGIVAMGLPALARTDLRGVSGPGWAGTAYSGMISVSIAYLIWYRGVERLGNARTAIYSNLVPVVALGVAWLWIGERPAPLEVAGGAVILAGLSLARLGGRGRSPAPPPAEE